jgi:ring-1,2-phenylacetyl-CoA epoxidase subunit PaaC
VQSALDSLWPYTVELFAEDELDRAMAEQGVAPRLPEVQAAWSVRILKILAEATLTRPKDRPHSWHGKRGQHSEHLGYILAEMQHLQRAYPGARW